MQETNLKSWKRPVLFILAMILITLLASVLTGLWVLTAIPIGFLFGFFLEKADLCGASAFSEVVMMRDKEKLGGIWVIIAVSMIGFALLASSGLIDLNPKHFTWANKIVGGVLFGIGIVLAGGCVSGCLFKTGQGNINSMAGLVGIPLGIAAVKYGPLNGLTSYLHQFTIKAPDGGAISLSTLIGLPYWLLALLIGIITIFVAWKISQKKRQGKPQNPQAVLKEEEEEETSIMQKLTLKRWKPWQAGLAIGILALAAYMSSASSGRNYPLGVTGGVVYTQLSITDAPLEYVYAPKSEAPPVKAPVFQSQTAGKESKSVKLWLILLVICLVIGANYSARITGKLQFKPRPPEQTVTSFFGGIILGSGAAIAHGCIVGNIMSGVALMSVGSILFAIVVIPTAWLTTYFYLMGGELKDLLGLNRE